MIWKTLIQQLKNQLNPIDIIHNAVTVWAGNCTHYSDYLTYMPTRSVSPTYGTMEGLGFKVQDLHNNMCSLVVNNNTCENIAFLGVFDCAQKKFPKRLCIKFLDTLHQILIYFVYYHHMGFILMKPILFFIYYNVMQSFLAKKIII